MTRFRIRLSTVLVFCLATVLGISLFWVSQQVQQLERQKDKVEANIHSEQEGMRVLFAEWDYLNRPDRIEALAKKYLGGMDSVAPENLLVDAKAVPEPSLMQEEDSLPVLVSTGGEKSDKNNQDTKPVSYSAAPDSKPIRDVEASHVESFRNVMNDERGGE